MTLRLGRCDSAKANITIAEGTNDHHIQLRVKGIDTVAARQGSSAAHLHVVPVWRVTGQACRASLQPRRGSSAAWTFQRGRSQCAHTAKSASTTEVWFDLIPR